jgi:hypothetical protein
MLAGQIDNLGKRIGIADRYFGQGFSIELDLRAFEPSNQLAIAKLSHSARRANARDPQSPKISFPHPAISKGVDPPSHQGHDRLPIKIMATKVKTFGQSAQSLAISDNDFAAACSGHDLVLVFQSRFSSPRLRTVV